MTKMCKNGLHTWCCSRTNLNTECQKSLDISLQGVYYENWTSFLEHSVKDLLDHLNSSLQPQLMTMSSGLK